MMILLHIAGVSDLILVPPDGTLDRENRPNLQAIEYAYPLSPEHNPLVAGAYQKMRLVRRRFGTGFARNFDGAS